MMKIIISIMQRATYTIEITLNTMEITIDMMEAFAFMMERKRFFLLRGAYKRMLTGIPMKKEICMAELPHFTLPTSLNKLKKATDDKLLLNDKRKR
jgi:hypothetical protein